MFVCVFHPSFFFFKVELEEKAFLEVVGISFYFLNDPGCSDCVGKVGSIAQGSFDVIDRLG